jgi:hypothetical protein
LVEYFDKLEGGNNEYEYSDKYYTAFYWQESTASQVFCVLVVTIANAAAAH